MVVGNPKKPSGIRQKGIYIMKSTIFAKRRTTKEGKNFYTFLTTLTKKDGTTITTSVRFSEDCNPPKPEECPLNVILDKTKCNLSKKKITNHETGETFESFTLWVKGYTRSADTYVDHSMDDFE